MAFRRPPAGRHVMSEVVLPTGTTGWMVRPRLRRWGLVHLLAVPILLLPIILAPSPSYLGQFIFEGVLILGGFVVVGLHLTGGFGQRVSVFGLSRRLGRGSQKRVYLFVVFVVLGAAAAALLVTLATNSR